MPDRPQAPQPKRKTDQDLLADAIPIDSLEDDDQAMAIEESASNGPSKIRGVNDSFGAQHRAWKRKPNKTGEGATHMKTFVAKLRPESIEHLDDQINEWLDEHPDYEVKLVTSAIGSLVGKNPEPALFVNVWV